MKRVKASEGDVRTGVYHKMLLEKRHNVMAGLGMKFDTLAKMGRVAEEDQAQLSHDEFVSSKKRSTELRRATSAFACPVKSRFPPSDFRRSPGPSIVWVARKQSATQVKNLKGRDRG